MFPLWWLTLWSFVLILTSFSSLGLDVTSTIRSHHKIVAQNGVVATDHGLCSSIGRDMLREGGHAVDAAVASALCLGVVSPASSGIGGGAFMLIRSEDGKAQVYDMRETAPKLASQNMYNGNTALKANGALSIAVPGEVEGLMSAWKMYGKLPWPRLVKPAAQLAENGFKIGPYLHMQMRQTESAIMADNGLRNIFTSNGSLLKIGDMCYNKKLARTLRLIAKQGKQALYDGAVGISLVQDIRTAGGILTMEDFRQYKVKLRKPIMLNVMGVKIIGMPPPSSGGAAMSLMLNILEQYHDLSKISDSLMIHREIEALKHALAVRTNLGDPDFVNIDGVMKDMMSKDFAAQLRKTIYDNMTFNASHYGGRWNPIHDHGTSHISIVDSQRNAVSMTTTINAYFGSKFLSPSTGIILNNEMDDFSMPANTTKNTRPPAPPNFILPGKRPLSSMSPTTVLRNEQLEAVVGASGGSFIIAGTAEVFLNHFVRGMDPLSAVLAPRLYHELIPNVLQYENWTVPTGEHFEVPMKIRANLKKKGYVLNGIAGGTICQFVVVQELHKLTAISDPRKGGFPSGF